MLMYSAELRWFFEDKLLRRIEDWFRRHARAALKTRSTRIIKMTPRDWPRSFTPAGIGRGSRQVVR